MKHLLTTHDRLRYQTGWGLSLVDQSKVSLWLLSELLLENAVRHVYARTSGSLSRLSKILTTPRSKVRLS